MSHVEPMPSVPLRHRVVRAGLWTGLLHGVTRGAGFVRNVLLARVLAPDDFGVFGIALVVLSIIERFSNTGLQSALIQKDRDVREYLDSAWTIQVARGALLCSALLLSASTLAPLLGDGRAAPFISMLGVVVCLRGMQNPGMLIYRRELEVRFQFLHRTGGALAELVVSIAMAVVLRSAWALILGLAAGSVAALIMSYVLHPYRPRVRLHWEQLRELSRYGRWVFVNNVLVFLAYRGDNLIIGKVLGARALGIYMLAYSISEVGIVEISRVTREIVFPAYSRIQSDIVRARRLFVVALDLIACVAFPLAAVLALMAGPLAHVVLGPRWIGVAAVLPPLALAGALRAIIGGGTIAFAALGYPALAFWTNLVAVVVTYLVVLPLLKIWGLLGVAIAVATGLTVALVPFAAYARRVLGLSPSELGRHLLPGMALVVIVAATSGGAKELLRAYSAGSVTVVIAVTLLSYATASAVLWVRTRTGPVSALMLLRSAATRRPAT